MKLFRILVIAALVYMGIVVAFESLIGFFQPSNASTLVLTTFDRSGASHERVLTRLDSGDLMYVAVNHWPRAWYHRLLEVPEVEVSTDGAKGNFHAVFVTGEEYGRIGREHPLPFFFRFLTGFPPRYFVRLDPSDPEASSLSPLARSSRDPELSWGACPDFFPAGCEIAILHGDPQRPNSDVFFRVPGGYDLPKHWHSSAERMILVTGRMQLAYDGELPLDVETGTYIYGPSEAPHEGRCVSDDACTLFIAFEKPIDAHLVASAD